MLPKTYDPKTVEDAIYKKWEQSGALTAQVKSKKKTFTISMPPPNATGSLHLGHAVTLALQDILIRFHRMRGDETLWLPGTDHAAIATENVVIKKLRSEGMADPRKQLGREELVKQIAQYVSESRGTIRSQIRKMGSSCDWSRERYTMDPALNRCVNEVFAKMHADGLIYRGHRIVNWDPKLKTTVSDDEVAHREERGPFYTFQYGPFQISTSRPETKFGDKYVVMHPKDKRHSRCKHGDTFDCEWINGPVRATIIKDEAVDPEFGTGVMTITPWHDAADFEIAERHGLEKEQIIDFSGTLLPIAGEFAGMKIEQARPKIVEKLKEKGLLVNVDENYIHNLATNSRGGGAIEPQIKLQWFIDVNKPVVAWKKKNMSLKEVMHDVVHHGHIKIIPDHFTKTYFHWIDNLRDWCISRQIWWGHRVPVYYCESCQLPAVSCQLLERCKQCKGPIEQDPDTLDTWFSSALWTWSTLVDPKLAGNFNLSLQDLLDQSEDFQKFHPTQVLETGYDILFFWVARMILMTTYATGRIPFETVYLHGLVRTRDGRKMSKSEPETMIDPVAMIEKYGADALRLSMIMGQSPGNDSRLYEEKIAGYRNFVNKLWNAARFVLMQCEQAGVDPKKVISGQWSVDSLSLADRALLHTLDYVLVDEITEALETHRLSEVGDRLYSFVWDYFCDWYLELSKGSANHAVLVHALRKILTLLHPYCPFVTEELWASIKPKDAGMLIVQEWSQAKAECKDQKAYDELQRVIDVISAIRKLRTDQNIEPGKKISVIIHTDKHLELIQSQREHIMRMGRIDQWTLDAAPKKHDNAASAFLDGIEVHVVLSSVDQEKERQSLMKDQQQMEKLVEVTSAKLKNREFVGKAPEKVVQAEREKLKMYEEKLRKVEEALRSFGSAQDRPCSA